MSGEFARAVGAGLVGAYLACRQRRHFGDLFVNVMGLALVVAAAKVVFTASEQQPETRMGPENQGEGDRVSARRYNERAKQFIEKNKGATQSKVPRS